MPIETLKSFNTNEPRIVNLILGIKDLIHGSKTKYKKCFERRRGGFSLRKLGKIDWTFPRRRIWVDGNVIPTKRYKITEFLVVWHSSLQSGYRTNRMNEVRISNVTNSQYEFWTLCDFIWISELRATSLLGLFK